MSDVLWGKSAELVKAAGAALDTVRDEVGPALRDNPTAETIALAQVSILLAIAEATLASATLELRRQSSKIEVDVFGQRWKNKQEPQP